MELFEPLQIEGAEPELPDDYRALAAAIIIDAFKANDEAFFRNPTMLDFWCDVACVDASVIRKKFFAMKASGTRQRKSIFRR